VAKFIQRNPRGLVLKTENSIDYLEHYKQAFGKLPLLTEEGEKNLSRNIIEKGDLEARNRLVAHNLRLAFSVASDYYQYFAYYLKIGKYDSVALDFDDFVQYANLGLIEAAERFDYRLGKRFSTYAMYWITQSIRRNIDDYCRIVRVPVHKIEKWRKMKRDIALLQARSEHKLTNRELAKLLGIPEPEFLSELAKMERSPGYTQSILSLDAEGDDASGKSERDEGCGETRYKRIPDSGCLNPEHLALIKEELFFAHKKVRAVTRLVKILCSERDKEIFRLRYGLDEILEPQTLESIAEKFSLTRERIRQILDNKIWPKLKSMGVKGLNDKRFRKHLLRIEYMQKIVGECPLTEPLNTN
jgi:RNA polymerase primary sigma factor